MDIVLAFLLAGAAGIAVTERVKPLSRKTILAALGISTLLGGAYAGMDASRAELQPMALAIPTSGVALSGEASFGVYWDVTGTRQVTEIAWGTLEPGQVGNSTFYVRNEAISEIYCAVTWREGSWQPVNASLYFELTWDYGEEPLSPNRARKVTLRLQVSPEIQGVEDFSFDIIITGQGDPFTG